MQPFPSEETSSADVLTHRPGQPLSEEHRQQKDLLSHLQSNLPDPLALLLTEEDRSTGSVLSNVSVEAAPLLAPETPPVAEKVILGQPAPLSQCDLWQMQTDYYSNKGIYAWQDNVPSFITSSVYIAETYVEIILAFIEDYRDRLDFNEPLYILELATGTGRFSNMVMRELSRKLAYFPTLADLKLKYVMTDFTDSNPTFWANHVNFRPFVENGLLDFAVMNPLAQDSLSLYVSGDTLAPGALKNPLIAIANYFFDSIPVDVFRVDSKTLKEGLVTLERTMEGVAPGAPPHISEIETTFHYRALNNAHYYPDAKLNAVLNHYRHQIKNGTFLMPTGAFDVVRNLQRLSNQRLVLISSDKAYTRHEDMATFQKHEYAMHSGAFSYMVNYDAIGQYFKNLGGHYFHTTSRNVSVQTVCCIEIEEPKACLPRLSYLYGEKIDRLNHINTGCTLLPSRNPDESAPVVLNGMLAQIRLNLCDPHIFFMLGQSLVDVVGRGYLTQHKDLMDLMAQAWQNYYHYPGESNLPFWFSQLYHVMGQYSQSLEMLDQSIALFGEHEALFFLKGQNLEKLEQWKPAEAMYERALAINAEFPEAVDALTAVRNRRCH